MDASAGLNTANVVEHTGVSVRQLNHWDRLGIVGPSLQPAIGSGSRRWYAAQDVLLILAASELRALGVSLDATRKAVAAIRHADIGLAAPTGTLLVGNSSGAFYLGTNRDAALDATRRKGAVYLLDLAQLAQRASAITAQVSVPRAELHLLAGNLEQVVVVPESHGFEARCNAYAGMSGHGATAEEAVSALREAVLRAAVAQNVDAEKPAGNRRPRSVPKRGAATWGEGW